MSNHITNAGRGNYIPHGYTSSSRTGDSIARRLAEIGDSTTTVSQSKSVATPRPLPGGYQSMTCSECGVTIRNGEWWRWRAKLSRRRVAHVTCPWLDRSVS